MKRSAIIPTLTVLFAGAGCAAGAIGGMIWSIFVGVATALEHYPTSSLTSQEQVVNALLTPVGLSILAAPIGAAIGCILGVPIGIVAGFVTSYYFAQMRKRNTFYVTLGMIAGGITLTLSTLLVILISGSRYEGDSSAMISLPVVIATINAWIASQVVARWYVKHAASDGKPHRHELQHRV